MAARARRALVALGIASLALGGCAGSPKVIDLTHPVPTFQQTADNPARPDTAKPWTELGAYPIYGEQAVLWLRQIPTNNGNIESGRITLWEHQGTHVDAPVHFLNTAQSTERGGAPAGQRQAIHQIDAQRLVGRVVVIDISARVKKELAKNGGRPSPDRSITDFSDSSAAVVQPQDIDAVADRLENGTWLVLNLGWSGFYFGEPAVPKSPYINGFNHPGMSRKATDRLIEVMDQRRIAISGIVADNIAIETGQVAHGDDDKRTNALHGHMRLLQRGVLLVENATNLDQLSAASASASCTLVVGAVKLGRGTGSPARVIALCN
jgi:kynurenine formamidase